MTGGGVLHGFIAHDGALVLWGEGDERAVLPAGPDVAGPDVAGPDVAGPGVVGGGAGPGDPGREQRGSSGGAGGRRGGPAWHPFALAAARLPAGDSRPGSVLVLPSTSAGPLPSPDLGRPARRGRPRFKAWAVPAVTVPFVTDDLAEEVGGRAAVSLRYLGEVCAFAADLVSRGRVLPALRPGPPARVADDPAAPPPGGAGGAARSGGGARSGGEARSGGPAFGGPASGGPAFGGTAQAFWRPVLTGADAVRRTRLAERMPAACRAERIRLGTVTGRPAADTLQAALDRLVDGLVRTRLAVAGETFGDPAAATDSSPPARKPDHRLPGGSDGVPDVPGRVAGDRVPGVPGRVAGDRVSAVPGRSPGDRLPDVVDRPVDDPLPAVVDRPSLGRRWLAALAGDPWFAVAPGEADEFADRLDDWHAGAAAGAAVRVCFRLSHAGELIPDGTGPADGAEDAWLVEFLLQAIDEPSVLVPATEVWQDRIAPLRRWTRHPQERLLAGLGRAARLFGDLTDALRLARPVDLVLDTEGAHRFLSAAALLEQAGFGVLLPAWWRQPRGLGLALEVRTRDPIARVLRDDTTDLAALVDYRWGLALGGQVLTDAELADLSEVKVPLVRLRGRWVHLDPDRLAAGLAFLGRGGGRMTAGAALRTIRLLPPEELPLPVTATGGEGWAAALLAGDLDRRLELLAPPADLAGELRPYQLRGFSWLVYLDALGLGALLADDMGLGKTVQLLALLLRVRRGPTLLICPLSVLGNWQREAARFAPSLRVRVLHGAGRPEPAGLLADADVVLTTYATATRDAATLAGIAWDRVVLDEAQHIKNSASATARAVRRFPARTRVALTGTPVENRLAELWSLMDWLNPGVLASAHTFRARFAVPIERYADEEAAARLRQAVRPFLLRRVKTDPAVITDLPDRRHVRHLCGLTAEQATLYRAVLDDMLQRLAESTDRFRKGIVLAGMTKLKLVCDHPALLLGDGSPLPGRSGKLDRLEEIVDRVLGDGDRALLFTQYARFGALLTPHLAARFGVPVRYLHGGTARGARDEMVAAFQADPRPGLFVLSLKAGGTGLNLTAANHVVHVDRWWNPATEQQATDRAYRIGQERDVQVHTLVCLGTLEERIDRLLADKGVLAERVVGDGAGWLTALSTGELREVLALAPEAYDGGEA